MDLSREKLESAFAKVITRNRELDPLTLSEKLVERLIYIMDDADGGSDIMPVRVVDEDGKDGGNGDESDGYNERLKSTPRATPRAITGRLHQEPILPPQPRAGLILTPDDPEFAEASRATQSKTPASTRRVSKIGHESETGDSVEHWTIESIQKALEQGTPQGFFFVPNGCDESMKVRAVRNIQWQMMAVGPHIVRLEYKNPGVSDDRSSVDSSGQLHDVVIGLTASETFDLSMRDLALDKAMESIVVQLEGLYAPRSQNTEPSGRDPGPLSFNMNDKRNVSPMGYDVPRGEMGDCTGNWKMVAEPSAVILRSVEKTNSRFGNR